MKLNLNKGMVCLIAFFLLTNVLLGQNKRIEFAPSFNPQECDEILQLNMAFMDTSENNANLKSGFLPGYTFKYRSPSMGMDNVWDLWIRADSTVVIMLRGTTKDPKSILADFYCAMLPAEGTIHFTEQDSFVYKLAEDKRAAVHAGFLVGFSFVAKDIQPRLDSLYQAGYRNYIVGGHSQGGSLCYYVSAWLHYLSNDDNYKGLRVKTYASAPTKVGNTYFVYDYDNAMRSEWAFSTTNSSDPVPEMPFTTQQVVIDMNEPNPILALKTRFDDLSFFKRIFMKRAFNRMEKRAKKSSEAYQKYLGGYLGQMVHNTIPELKLPAPISTTNFLRPGVPISLMATDDYNAFFQKQNKTYYHHDIQAYRWLLRKYYTDLSPL